MTESSFIVEPMPRAFHIYNDIQTAAVVKELTCETERFSTTDFSQLLHQQDQQLRLLLIIPQV